MKTKRLFHLVFLLAIAGFTLSGCSSPNDDYDEIIDDGNNEDDNDNGEDDNGGNTGGDVKKDKIVGCWYYAFIDYEKRATHMLYKFDADMHYTYQSNDGSSSSQSGGTYRYNSDSIFFQPDDGKAFKRKINKLTNDEFMFNGTLYNATSLPSLSSGNVPGKSETALMMWCGRDEKGNALIEIIPYWGISKFYYSFSESKEDKMTMRTSYVTRTYTNVKPGTTYYLTAYAVDSKGVQHPTKTISITMPGAIGTKNYFNFNYKTYPLERVVMSQKHFPSGGTGQGSNTKYLTFYSTDDTYVQFEYNVAEWEGINKEWVEGTYTISRIGGYYKYSCHAKIDGKLKSPSDYDFTGKLVIKKTSNYYTFDFTLEEMKGHFEGSVK